MGSCVNVEMWICALVDVCDMVICGYGDMWYMGTMWRCGRCGDGDIGIVVDAEMGIWWIWCDCDMVRLLDRWRWCDVERVRWRTCG